MTLACDCTAHVRAAGTLSLARLAGAATTLGSRLTPSSYPQRQKQQLRPGHFQLLLCSQSGAFAVGVGAASQELENRTARRTDRLRPAWPCPQATCLRNSKRANSPLRTNTRQSPPPWFGDSSAVSYLDTRGAQCRELGTATQLNWFSGKQVASFKNVTFHALPTLQTHHSNRM